MKKLMAGDGPLQMSLSGQQDLAEISSPDFPGERLIACRNPVPVGERARKRQDLAATEKLLALLIARVRAGRLAGAGTTGIKIGKVTSKYKDRQALHRHRRQPDRDPRPGQDRRQHRPGRILRAGVP